MSSLKARKRLSAVTKVPRLPWFLALGAFTPATLLVLVGFSAAVPEPLAVNPPDATMVLPLEGAVGRDGLAATEEFGGDVLAPFPALLVLLGISAAGESATLTAIVEIADGHPIDAVTAGMDFSSFPALGNGGVAIGWTGARLNPPA